MHFKNDLVTGPPRSNFPLFGSSLLYIQHAQYLARSCFTSQMFTNNLLLSLYFWALVTRVHVFADESELRRGQNCSGF
jgi:hypothetical protein